MMENLNHKALIIVFGVLLLAGAVMDLLRVPYAEIFFSVGAFLAVVQAFVYAITNKTDDIRQARLHRLNFVASLFLGIAAYFMWIESSNWVVFTLVYVVIVLFLSFRAK